MDALETPISELIYTDADTASDMSNKVHGIVDVIEAEAARWQVYRLHVLDCFEIKGTGKGRCAECTEIRNEVRRIPEPEARHHAAEAAWRGHVEHSHEVRVINWVSYGQIINRLCDTITTTRQAARRMLIDDAELTERAFSTLADNLSELGGVSWDEAERMEALMTESTEAYQAWMTQYRALVALVTSDQSLAYLGRAPHGDTAAINFVMYVARLRSMETQRQYIDDQYNRIVQQVNDERRAMAEARK
jgi:hypothetical protein